MKNTQNSSPSRPHFSMVVIHEIEVWRVSKNQSNQGLQSQAANMLPQPFTLSMV